MRRLVSVSAAVALAAAMPAVAFAHGGRYVPPPGEVPPDSREPSDPPPPPDGDGPATPPGDPSGGPGTPSGGPTGGPTTPGGPSGRGPSSPSGPSGGPTGPAGGPGGVRTGGPGRKAPGYSSWLFWWVHNKDEILQLKSAVKRTQANGVTGSSFGRTVRGGVQTVTDAAIRDSVVPALRKLLRDGDESFHIRSAAELGLAKIGDAETVAVLREMAVNRGQDLHREIQESAALALGLLQRDDPETRMLLIETVLDRSKDGTYTRPFAAIALGLLGANADRDGAAVASLLDVVGRREAGADIKPACLAGLGLLGGESAIAPLVATVREGKAPLAGAVPLSEVEIAFAVGALGKIGRAGSAVRGEETAALDAVLALVAERSDAGPNVRRSAAIALGQIGRSCEGKAQRRAVAALADLLEPNVEEQERNFAVMSLARIAAAPRADAALRKDVVARLGRTMEKGSGQTPAFAGLALGLIARGIHADGGATPEEEIRAPLRERFAARGDPQLRGAFALASGLAQDHLAARSLLATLKDETQDRRVRGWCALGLGLLDVREATPTVRTVLREESDRDLRTQAAIAAGLLNDPSVIEDLVAVIVNRESSNYELGSAASALGQIGDERAIQPLVAIALDADRYPALTRALAVVALGQIGDRRDLPTLARIATDLNYRAHVPAIGELVTIL